MNSKLIESSYNEGEVKRYHYTSQSTMVFHNATSQSENSNPFSIDIEMFLSLKIFSKFITSFLNLFFTFLSCYLFLFLILKNKNCVLYYHHFFTVNCKFTIGRLDELMNKLFITAKGQQYKLDYNN